MNIKQIVNNAKKELQNKNIEYTDIYILETKWGYVVQTRYANRIDFLNTGKNISSFTGKQIEESGTEELEISQYDCKDSFVALFCNDGQIFFPFTKTNTAVSSGIYKNKEAEQMLSKYQKINIGRMIEEDKNKHCDFFNLFPYKVDLTGKINFCEETILYKELDDRHFIISIGLDKKMLALFYIDDNNNVIHCGNISGEIYTFNEQLAKNKTLLLKDENNELLFSWEKNSIISDKWSKIVTIPFYMKLDLKNIKNMLPEITEYIINLIEKSGGFLAILELKSGHNEEKIQFFSVLGSDGLAITDLMFITDTYEIKTMKLSGEPVGTLDTFREEGQKRLDERTKMIEDNKKNILTSLAMITSEEGINTGIEDNAKPKYEMLLRRKHKNSV